MRDITVTIRPAQISDAEAIAEIYNEAILTTTATFQERRTQIWPAFGCPYFANDAEVEDQPWNPKPKTPTCAKLSS
jgi:hypothetical protein